MQDRWPPLLQVDMAGRDGLHGFAVSHLGFVAFIETLSTIGSWWVYLLVFAMIAGWLLWRRLPRLALFVAVTVGVNPYSTSW